MVQGDDGILSPPVNPHALNDFSYDYDKHVLHQSSAEKLSSETTFSPFL